MDLESPENVAIQSLPPGKKPTDLAAALIRAMLHVTCGGTSNGSVTCHPKDIF